MPERPSSPQDPNAGERRQVSIEWLGWQLGRLEEILTQGIGRLERQVDSVNGRLSEHDRRLLKLEHAEESRRAIEEAEERARREALAHEDRFGARSPRGMLVAALTVGGGVVVGVLQLIASH